MLTILCVPAFIYNNATVSKINRLFIHEFMKTNTRFITYIYTYFICGYLYSLDKSYIDYYYKLFVEF